MRTLLADIIIAGAVLFAVAVWIALIISAVGYFQAGDAETGWLVALVCAVFGVASLTIFAYAIQKGSEL